jgi:thioredoxin-related protein
MDAPAPPPGRPHSSGARWRPILLIAIVLSVYFVLTRPQPPLEGWRTDFEAALGEAATSGRLILVAFSLPGCAPCKVMERTVLNRDEVRSALTRFVPVRVDLAERRDLANRFAAFSAPTYVIVSPEGRRLAHREGPQSVEQFVAFLAQVSTSRTPDDGPTAAHPPDGS